MLSAGNLVLLVPLVHLVHQVKTMMLHQSRVKQVHLEYLVKMEILAIVVYLVRQEMMVRQVLMALPMLLTRVLKANEEMLVHLVTVMLG